MTDNTTTPFKHYVITRFNIGLYSAGTHKDPDQWMQHRLKIFTNITLPSMKGQTCQNFTWLILIDPKTPKKFCDVFNAFNYDKIRFITVEGIFNSRQSISAAILNHIEKGNHDLITTRIDCDDAFNCRMIEKIQYWHTPRPDRWMITFPVGATMDIKTKEMYPIEYLFNPFPTLIEKATDPVTIFAWPHWDIQVEVKEFIVGDFYWLQIVHSSNIDNSMEKSSKNVMRDKPFKPEILKSFGLDPDKILNTDFEIFSKSNARQIESSPLFKTTTQCSQPTSI